MHGFGHVSRLNGGAMVAEIMVCSRVAWCLSDPPSLAYPNSDEQVWVPPLDRFDQFFMGKGLFRPRTPLAAFFVVKTTFGPALAQKLRLRGKFGASAGDGKLQIDEFSAYLFQHCQSKLLSSKIVFLKKHK